MAKIKILDNNLINKIAAGEVVERPASVVKELLDNSIDANATHITLELVEGGKKLIRITDDGNGMDKEDLKLCLTRHATSKIVTENDLFSVLTNGFRGEALSSIGAVSELTISTKQDNKGYKLTTANEQIDITETSTTKGTIVEIKNIFKNIPARHKFLKATSTELKHCIDTFNNIALSNPNLGFKLVVDNKNKTVLPKNQKILDRIKIIFGNNLASNLLSVATNTPHIKIYGFVGKPEVASRNAEQITIVNKRPINDRLISSAIKDSYSNLVMPKLKPTFFIYIDVPPDYIDVNIHPQKKEIKFLNTNEIYRLIKNTVSKALTSNDLTYGSFNINEAKPKNLSQTPNTPSFNTKLKPDLKYSYYKPTPFVASDNITSENIFSLSQEQNQLKYFILNNLYIVANINNELIIIDQHAAHERILYNKIKNNFSKNPQSQSLLIPVTLELNQALIKVFEENQKIFTSIGFEFKNLQILSKPTFVKENEQSYIKDVLEEIVNGKEFEDIQDKTDRVIATMACKAAVKAGDKLSQQEVLELINSLDKESDKYTCPHGRPLKVNLKFNDVNKLFKRII